jgi:hypothetical protein
MIKTCLCCNPGCILPLFSVRRYLQAEAQAITETLSKHREQARSELPEEPSEDAAEAVLVRVRLPGGGVRQRRFPAEASVDEVRRWVATLEEMPLSSVPSWRLVTSFPRSEPEGGCTVRELAAGSAAVALFVELE